MFLGAYRGARVLVTGHTGFKGAWLSLWLHQLGAEVCGLSLSPEPGGLYDRGGLASLHRSQTGDIRDFATVERVVHEFQPEVVLHLAAQALVRESYKDPVGTMASNVMGVAHVCEALRKLSKPCALVVVTSDKCYENCGWVHGYREIDPMGGSDPYSASKGAAELVTSSWRRSYFSPDRLAEHGKAVASARAGNVIGPGDWAKDRIVPDTVGALAKREPVVVRNPAAVRPWQHVLEPLSGYLWLGAQLRSASAARFATGWNFGPLPESFRTVRELVEGLIGEWGSGEWKLTGEVNAPHEAHVLRLSIDKAAAELRWSPTWGFAETIRRTARGYRALAEAERNPGRVRDLLAAEINEYVHSASLLGAPWSRAQTT